MPRGKSRSTSPDSAREGNDTTWTSSPSGNENLPINCVSWFEGLAFCIWDGGFLPSETEWEYAAAGGSEQRTYPWGTTAPDCAHANFVLDGASCSGTSTHSNPVGSLPVGDGVWEHSDLAGNVREWCLIGMRLSLPNVATVCNWQPARCAAAAAERTRKTQKRWLLLHGRPSTRRRAQPRLGFVALEHQMKSLIEPSTILAGKYRVERVLGSGGMGTVIFCSPSAAR